MGFMHGRFRKKDQMTESNEFVPGGHRVDAKGRGKGNCSQWREWLGRVARALLHLHGALASCCPFALLQ